MVMIKFCCITEIHYLSHFREIMNNFSRSWTFFLTRGHFSNSRTYLQIFEKFQNHEHFIISANIFLIVNIFKNIIILVFLNSVFFWIPNLLKLEKRRKTKTKNEVRNYKTGRPKLARWLFSQRACSIEGSCWAGPGEEPLCETFFFNYMWHRWVIFYNFKSNFDYVPPEANARALHFFLVH